MKTYVTKKWSEKKSKEYIALIGEKGGREYFLSVDRNTCMYVADISPRQLDEMNVGDKIEV